MDGIQRDRHDAFDSNMQEQPGPAPIQAGRMSGFYFHENSEPYQQLTLRHVPETTHSTFELR